MQAPRSPRRWLLLVVIAAALTVAGPLGVRLARDDARQAAPQDVLLNPTDTASPLATVPGGSRPASRDSGRGITVRYRFDAGVAGSVTDEARLLPLRAATAQGGALTTVAHGGGLAVRFPAPCPNYGAKECARAILESGPAEVLNPGTAPLRYGAAVHIAPDETTKGANVIQKGYSQGDSQYKLQIDGADGHPSCVLVGVGSTHINVVKASVTVANGQWHVIECVRSGAALTIVVDGVTRGQLNVPIELSIVNKEPLRIGGKGTSPNNDQFTGSIDDAFVIIGA